MPEILKEKPKDFIPASVFKKSTGLSRTLIEFLTSEAQAVVLNEDDIAKFGGEKTKTHDQRVGIATGSIKRMLLKLSKNMQVPKVEIGYNADKTKIYVVKK